MSQAAIRRKANLALRDAKIRADFLQMLRKTSHWTYVMVLEKLAQKYCLSVRTIERIVR